ncbi:Sda1 [Hexamita inflata]|uniref:Protein SDA1 n=1 Tax=Hexamita inflata TaxID=28002 RepID=A0AA86RGF4_9EUKA|nr:Sda1 [Hexamita inflata]
MPDLLKLQYQAKNEPESYKLDVLSQYKVFEARIELFKMAPQQRDQEFIELINFIAHMSKLYPELKQVPDIIFNLLIDQAPSINAEFRMDLYKAIQMLVNQTLIPINQHTVTKFFSLLALHDKPLRAAVTALLLKHIPRNLNDSQILNPFQTYIQSQNCSTPLQAKLLDILHQLYYDNHLKSENQFKRVVNIFADQLIKSPDKRIVTSCLNFLLNEDVNDDDEDQGNEINLFGDDPLIADDLNKLYAELKTATQAFKIDENRRRKEVERLQAKIRKIKFQKSTKINVQLNTLDYLRSPSTLADQLIGKFLNKSCQMYLRMRIFELLARVIDLYQLLTPALFPHYAKYMRPKQDDVSELMENLIKSVNINQQPDEIKQVINQIVLNFVHSGSTDDEMVLGINCITEICKRAPHVLLEDEDGLSVLNELMSYSTNKSVLHSHDAGKSAKTSAATRKGVVMASRALINFYRKVAPGYINKKYLDRDSSMMLQNLKKLDQDTKFINFDDNNKPITRIPNIEILEHDNEEEEEEFEEEEVGMTKNQQQKMLKYKKHYYKVLQGIKKSGRLLSITEIEEIQMYCGFKVNERGEKVEDDSEDEYAEYYEESESSGAQIDANDSFADAEVVVTEVKSDFVKRDVRQTIDPKKLIQEIRSNKFNKAEDKLKNYIEEVQEDEKPDEQLDPNIPIEQQRFLTQDEVMRLKEKRRIKDKSIDLNKYRKAPKMTIEEKRAHTLNSKDISGHKSNYWSRKDITKCSRSNKEKQSDKAMAMIVHSDSVKRKASRSRREKEMIRRTHAYNMKRGISKKAKM